MNLAIGPRRLDSPVVLAPMSGVTDLPFRRAVRAFGPELVVSEMIASKELLRDRADMLRRAAYDGAEEPSSMQLAGREAAPMAEAARIAEGEGAQTIDINMGCPAKHVAKGQAGAALMRDEDLALSIVEAVIAAVDVPVTLKMRTGWDKESRNAPSLAAKAEAAGVQMLTVHGRTRAQFYKGEADWDFVAEVVDKVSIPVLVNGDIVNTNTAREALVASGAAGVMIGRACLGRPWLLAQIAAGLKDARFADPGLADQGRILTAQYEDALSFYGAALGVRTMRKHIAEAMAVAAEGCAVAPLGWQEARRSICREEDPNAVLSALSGFFAACEDARAAA